MATPPNKSGLFTGHDPTRGPRQECFKMSRVGLKSVQNKISRVRSGRVKRFSNLVGRVGSGNEMFKISRVGSGHDPRYTGHARVVHDPRVVFA